MRGNKEWKADFLKGMAPLLKAYSFSRKGSTFSREGDGLEYIVNVQSSQDSTATLWKFTINLVIKSALVASRHDISIANEIHHWEMRIGQLLPTKMDAWWTVTNEARLTAVIEDPNQYLSEHALPELLSVSSVEDLKRMWEKGIAPGLTEGQRKEYISLLAADGWNAQ